VNVVTNRLTVGEPRRFAKQGEGANPDFSASTLTLEVRVFIFPFLIVICVTIEALDQA
jgi:hypothetical protein